MKRTQDKVTKIWLKHKMKMECPNLFCSYRTIYTRLKNWWTEERTINTPKTWAKRWAKKIDIRPYLSRSTIVYHKKKKYHYCGREDDLWFAFKRCNKCPDWELYRSFKEDFLIDYFRVNGFPKKETDVHKKRVRWTKH